MRTTARCCSIRSAFMSAFVLAGGSVVGCSGSSSSAAHPSGDSGTGASSSTANPAGDAGSEDSSRSTTRDGSGNSDSAAYPSLASGTFTATGVSATITAVQVSFTLESTDAESNSTFVVSTINNPDGGGNLPGLITFGNPAGVTMSVLVSSIELAGGPTTGTFTAATNGCGSVEVEYGTDVGDTDVFTAVSGSTCTDGGMQTARGSWSLNLTSTTLSSGSSDPYTTVDLFAVHGTFTAMLADPKGSPGTLSLTF